MYSHFLAAIRALIMPDVVPNAMATTETWSDPNQCPFCDAQLTSPGAGFVDHLEQHPDCQSRFDAWRDRITDDICGGWMG